MADNTSVWTFVQLGGNQDSINLSDHCAPHGRPRRKPVVETELKLRFDTVRYSGTSAVTRHVFGTMDQPQKIVGRFSDAYGGSGFARTKRRALEAFVGAAQPCSVTWDDLVSEIVFITSVKFGIESGGEMSYELEYEVDKNQLHDEPGDNLGVIEAKGPQDITADINKAIADMNKLTEVPGMRGSVFDSISSLISSVAAASSALNTVAGQIDSFANAPFQLMNQLRSALDQFRTAIVSLRKTYDDLQVNIALENQNASSWQSFFDVKAAWAASSLDAIRQAIAMDRAAAIAQQGNILAVYTAKDGDTWDAISRIAYSGSADRAADIRAANGIEPGANPVPGTTYMVPV